MRFVISHSITVMRKPVNGFALVFPDFRIFLLRTLDRQRHSRTAADAQRCKAILRIALLILLIFP
jgi:hypothetical protein